jgi:two-component system, OmpR family, copper resistance phosphate regulon response regulator CusR
MFSVLIAEDEDRLASFIEKGLRKNGFTAVVAPDGEKALQMASENQFGLVLLDLGLPLKNGWAVLNELRSQGEKLPIIVVSAVDDERSKIKALASGANDYVTKPFSFKDLLTKVKSYVATD